FVLAAGVELRGRRRGRLGAGVAAVVVVHAGPELVEEALVLAASVALRGGGRRGLGAGVTGVAPAAAAMDPSTQLAKPALFLTATVITASGRGGNDRPGRRRPG